MSYSLNCEDDDIDVHYCSGCDGDKEEHARIRRGAWVHKSVYPALKANITSAALWNQHKATRKVVVLPELQGSFDGGTPKYVPGYGDLKERFSGSDFKLTVRDPVYQKNFGHYESLAANPNWHFAYCSEGMLHLSDVPVTVGPKNPIADDVEALVVWESDISFFQKFTPAPHPIPAGVFDCEATNVALRIVVQPVGITINEGSDISLSVVAEGTMPLTYQWYKGTTLLTGQTGAGLYISNAKTTDAGSYTVKVTDVTGTLTSSAAAVVVNAIVFDTTITFATAATDTKESVAATIPATNANAKFEFNKDTSITGSPTNMTLKLSGTSVCTVSFPSDYLGQLFRYTHTDNVKYLKVFTAGDVVL